MSLTDQPEPELQRNPAAGFFQTLINMLRAVSIMAALGLSVTGAFLAYDLFYFVKIAVEDPQGLISDWQAVLHVEEDLPAPATTAEAKAPAPMPATAPTPAAAAASDTNPAPDSAPSSEADEPSESSTDTVPAGGETPAAEAPTSAEPLVAEAPVPIPGPNQQNHRRNRENTPPSYQVVRDPWVSLAMRVLDNLEKGDFRWVSGFLLLLVCCFILARIPLAMLSTGGKILVDLFKAGRN